jgi:hypothetical protein
LQAEARATDSEKQAVGDKRKAEEAAWRQRTVLEFFKTRVLAAARPKDQAGGLGHDVTIRAAVDATEPWIGLVSAGQREVESEIRDTLGMAYFYLRNSAPAIRQHEWALTLREDVFGPDHPSRSPRAATSPTRT